MSLRIKNVFMLTVLLVSVWSADIQNLNGQSSLHDSLRHTLTVIEERARQETLRKEAKDARALYTGDTINNLLSEKLLVIDSILVNYLILDQQTTSTYAQTLTPLFADLPPKQEHPDYAASINYLAVLHMNMGRYEPALQLCEQALTIRKKILGEEHPDYAESINNLAKLYYHIGQFDKAIPLYHQSLAIRKKVLGEEHPGYADGLNNLVLLYSYTGRYDKALPLCKQALSIRQKVLGEEHPDYATSINNLGILYWQMGLYDKALPLYEQAIGIRQKVLGEDHSDYAESLNYRAILYVVMGQYDKALPLFQQSLAIRRKAFGEEHPQYAYSLNALAFLYNISGQYDKALPLFQQSLAIKRKIFGKEHPEYAGTLNNLALLYHEMGQYEKAVPLYEQDIAIFKKALGKEHPGYANSLNNLADVYKDMGQYDKALALYKQALAIRKKALGEEHHNYTESLNNLANLYKDMRQYSKALPLYEQALAIRKKVLGEEHPDYATSVNNLALLYRQMGRYEKSLPLYKQALAIRKKVLGEEHPDYAESLTGLGLLYSSLGTIPKSYAFFSEACKSTLKHLNQTYVTLSEQEKLELIKVKLSNFDYLPSLLFTQGVKQSSLTKQVYDNEIALKGMVLEDQKGVLSNIRNSGDSSALHVYEQWRFNKALVGKQLILPFAQRLPYLDSLQDATNELEQQLSRYSTPFREWQRTHAITTKEIAQTLQKNEAAVEFIRFHLYNKKWTDTILYTALLLLPGDSLPHFIPLFEERTLQRILTPFFSAKNTLAQYTSTEKLYGKVFKNKPGDLQTSLYKLLWKPLEHYLQGIHTVYYAPAGLLHRVSFQALRPNTTSLLIDKYQLRQVLNTRSVTIPVKSTQKPGSVSLWGNIEYNMYPSSLVESPTVSDTSFSSFNFYTYDTRSARGGDWEFLPGSRKEIELLATLFRYAGVGVRIDSSVAATEEVFKSLTAKSPQVVHLATHGFFLPVKEKKGEIYDVLSAGSAFRHQQNPMFRSGLILAGGNYAWRGKPGMPGREDGILTAYEIAQLDLSNTDLVVLSACETALGDLQGSEEVIGLQRAFKLAGAKQLIMSLWQVPDKETMELMLLFYENWMRGQSVREALRKAQLTMKEKYPPYYWAGFVMAE